MYRKTALRVLSFLLLALLFSSCQLGTVGGIGTTGATTSGKTDDTTAGTTNGGTVNTTAEETAAGSATAATTEATTATTTAETAATAAETTAPADPSETFVPVLRVALTSDVHTRVMNDNGATETATVEDFLFLNGSAQILRYFH